MNKLTDDNLYGYGGHTELIKALNERTVEFIVVGGFAIHFYARSRKADDLDLLISANEKNRNALIDIAAHNGFRIEDKALTVNQHINFHSQVFYADIFTPLPGIVFEDIWQKTVEGKINGQYVRFPSLDDVFLLNQLALSRVDQSVEMGVEQFKKINDNILILSKLRSA